MHRDEGRVSEIRLWDGQEAAWITCPAKLIPAPGKYTLAWSPEDGEAPLATALFASQVSEQGFLAALPALHAWGPGTRLSLRGPLGRGFHLPPVTRRIALVALAGACTRLLPLVQEGLARHAAVALFTDVLPSNLPTSVEVAPLSGLAEALTWADFLAIDVPMEDLPGLVQVLGTGGRPLPCPAQALVVTPMPCAGAAECGACAMKASGKWKLACKDGPVFDLDELLRGL